MTESRATHGRPQVFKLGLPYDAESNAFDGRNRHPLNCRGLVPPDLRGHRPHRAGRTLRQAARQPHGPQITGSWDEEAGDGYLLFDREGPVLGRFDVISSASDLRLELRTEPERADRLEFIVGIHLARFGARDSLAISWERTDDGEGTTQGPLTPEEVEAHARAKKAARAATQSAGQAE